MEQAPSNLRHLSEVFPIFSLIQLELIKLAARCQSEVNFNLLPGSESSVMLRFSFLHRMIFFLQ